MRNRPLVRLRHSVIMLLFVCSCWPGGGGGGDSAPLRLWVNDAGALKRADRAETSLAEASGTAAPERASRTDVTPHPRARIPVDRNLVWCAGFHLAWDALRKYLKAPVRLAGDPPDAAILNDTRSTAYDLDEASYVAMAGRPIDGFKWQLKRTLSRKFPDAPFAEVDRLPGLFTNPLAVVTYSYLEKDLRFAMPFESLETPVDFEGHRLEAFGISQGKEASVELRRQVIIHSYRSADDFVIELQTTSPGDRLILAKTAPAETLAETIEQVQARLRENQTLGPAPSRADSFEEWMEWHEKRRVLEGNPMVGVLIVPRFNFDLAARFPDLEAPLVNERVNASAGARTFQRIRFELDECGARLRAESSASWACSYNGPPKYICIFNKPFLLMLQHDEAASPYFAMWTTNTELMVKADQD